MKAVTRDRRVVVCVAACLVLGLALAAHAGDAAEPGERLSNTLRWSTASEVNNFGFDVLRSTKEEGPFKPVNEDPVPGAGTVDTPSDYVYVDDTIVAGQEYFYYVESISMSGERERLTPVFRAPPKGGDDASAAPSE